MKRASKTFERFIHSADNSIPSIIQLYTNVLAIFENPYGCLRITVWNAQFPKSHRQFFKVFNLKYSARINRFLTRCICIRDRCVQSPCRLPATIFPIHTATSFFLLRLIQHWDRHPCTSLWSDCQEATLYLRKRQILYPQRFNLLWNFEKTSKDFSFLESKKNVLFW